ncbi:ATP-dependent RNA helicase DDX51/DBP6 [Entomortierella parvispora]|uniref:ATP-dependent RNA helicase n=1 Tax=Entomortierella parvispora TaxID=205924 RepID=A0A9P3HBW1_9FUNG|nr:ATP-dependent RNA helicase DDX51/DBP6 [Entomortierella parvispora]
MFNIKRFDVDADSTGSSPSTTTAAQDRLAKLNSRLNKNKAFVSPTSAPEQRSQPFKDHNKSRPSDTKHYGKDQPKEISYKRTREFEEARVAKEEAKRGKKWEKKAKELKDSDLIPNDVRLAMKAEAEAEAAGLKTPVVPTPAPSSLPADSSLQAEEDKDVDMEGTYDVEPSAQAIDMESEEQGLGDMKKFLDDAAADAALADVALVPLPSFEAKEISATEKERAKSMGVPDWLAHPTKIEPDTNTPIDAPMFGFSPRLIKQCKKAGIEDCFAVQTAVIPVLMRARHLGDIRKAPGDLCVSAPTGSGKTLAYVLPIIEILSQRVVTRLRALVVLPTRDLCIQVKETFETFVKGTDLKIATSTGQNSFAHEQNILVGDINSPVVLGGHSRIDVLITTPGRLIDHIKSTPNFTLQHLRFLVIDEADRLLNQSFQDWLYHILTAIHPSDRRLTEKAHHHSHQSGMDALSQQNQMSDDEKLGLGLVQIKTDAYGFPIHDAIAPGFLPSFFDLPESDVEDSKALSVQKLLFSATLTRNPAKIASLQLSDPQYVAVQEVGEAGEEKQKYTTPAGLTEHMIVCETSEKPLMVLHLLHHLQVRSALCFTKSVESAHRLYKLIQLYEKIRTNPSLMPAASTPKAKQDASKEKRKEDEESDSDSSDSSDSDSGDSDSSDNDSDSSDDNSSSSSDDEDDDDASDVEKEAAKDVEMENVEARTATPPPEAAEVSATTALSSTKAIVVAEYSSDLPKAKRQAILRAFNAGEIQLLICSDLISRGMDLSPVENVINYDSPVYMKKYIHRVGRTARAGKTGTAYSLVEMQEARHFKEMISKAGHWEKIARIKVKDQEVKDLVPAYKVALEGLKEVLVTASRSSRKGHFRGHNM